jgi:hypothetical protein
MAAKKGKSIESIAKERAAKAAAAGKPAAPASTAAQAMATFDALRSILKRHVPPLQVIHERPGSYSVHSRVLGPDGKPYWFGGAAVRRENVSYYLFPVYVEPQLLEGVSPALRKRMEGKSCFTFTKTEPALLRELESLTARGVERWKKGGVV